MPYQHMLYSSRNDDADIPKDDLARFRLWMGASAPLDRKVADEIKGHYGFQCLQGWVATEMLGTAAAMGVDETGRIEVWRADFPGDHWMTTNDLGRIDAVPRNAMMKVERRGLKELLGG